MIYDMIQYYIISYYRKAALRVGRALRGRSASEPTEARLPTDVGTT